MGSCDSRRTRRRGARGLAARLLGVVEELECRALLSAGLVAAYGFDEASGTAAVDASGTGNAGTVSGAARIAGKYGGALSFNGTSDLVTVADAASLDLTAAMTLEAWVRPTARTDWTTVLMKERPGGFAYALYGSDGANRPPAAYVYRTSDVAAVGASALALGAWSHLAASYDGANLRLYVNGALVRTTAVTGSLPVTASPLRIGGNGVWGEYFAGAIDEVRVYNRALPQAEIQTDMNAPVAAPDTTAPAVSVTAPAGGATLGGSVGVTADASDDRGVVGVQFLLNGNALGSEDTAAPYSVSWDTLAGLNGAYTLTARARDAAGNSTTSAPVGVTVANAGRLVIDSPVNGATISGTTIDVRYHAAGDPTGVDHVHFSLDGGPEVMDIPMDGVYQFANVPSGTHVINGWLVRADHTKIAGTDAAPVSVTTNSGDTQAPGVSLTAPAAGATVSGASAQVTASASDNVGVAGVQFLVDGNPLGPEDVAAPYATTWDTTTSANGAHVLSARARDAAGNVTTSAGVTVTVANSATDPAVVGQWSSVMNWPIVAINMVLLKTGKVLMWDGGPDCIGATSATLWDPATNVFTPVPSETQRDVRDIFCSAQTVLADGRVLVVGGHECVDPAYLGAAIANIFDPVTQTWTKLPDMAYRRWYPTSTMLPDGRALVTAGSDLGLTTYVPIQEVYNPVTNSFTKLTAGSMTIPNYPFMYVLPDGRILAAASDEGSMPTRAFDVATQTWTMVDSRVLDAGSAVMYRPGKVMKSGSHYYSDSGSFDRDPASATTYTIDMTQPSPTWTQTASMAAGRAFHNLTVLPDGNVLVTGGARTLGGYDPATAVLSAEMWSPDTQSWTTLSSMHQPRMYHSTAMLMPDGRILSAGGGHNYVNNADYFSAEYYSPPYLFKGARPTVSSSPAQLKYNTDFFVGTPDASRIASVSLVRNGSVTHQVNMDQRFVPLGFTQTAGGLTVHAPVDANLAPPGYYMLFIVDSNGVPSVAPFVRLPAAYEDTQAPTAPTGLTAAGAVSAATLNWLAATDNNAVSRYNVYRSATSGFSPGASTLVGTTTSTTYGDSGLAAGTYYYRITAQDAAGNVGPASNEAAATVTADSAAPAVAVTSPSPGGTLSGAATATASASDNVGVVGVQFLLDGGLLGAEDTSAPYSVTWNTSTTINGGHTLTARARDAAGNVTTSAPVAVTVSNAAPSSLVGAWGFNEGAGTTAADASGNGLDGSVFSATWTTAGKFGGALSFDGINDWVTVVDNNLLDLARGMTIEAWVRPNALTGWTTAVMKERGTAGMAYAMYASDGGARPPAGYINPGTSDISAAGTAAIPLGAWSHLAVTYDGAMLRVYVNGAQAGTQASTVAAAATADPLRIGGNAVWGEYFNGLIDEVRVYNVARTAAEVQGDMNTPVAPPAPDTTAPDVSISSPAGGATVAAAVGVSAAASDDVGVAGVQFFVDGSPLGAEDAAAPYSVTWDTTTTANGQHVLTARARDAAGNAKTSAGVTVSVSNQPDLTPPAVSVSAPAGGATLFGTVPVTAAASDNVGVAGVRFYLDGLALGGEDTAAPYSVSWDTTSAAEGSHVLSAVARDAAGNSALSPGVTVIVQNSETIAPSVSLTAPGAGAVVSGSVAVNANASDNRAVAAVQFLLDGNILGVEDTSAPYSVTWNSVGSANGTHTLVARARDAAGNFTDSAPVSVTVSNTAAAGLVAAWGFDDGTGTVAADSTGNGHTGTVSGATWVTSGKFGKALSFNGINDWVTVADANALDLTTAMTLEAWINPSSLVGYTTVVMKERTGGLAYSLYASDGSGRPPAGYINRSGSDVAAVGTSVLPLNAWSHLAVTYDAASLRLYVNGALVLTRAVTGSIVTSTGVLRIGGNSVWGEYFAGLIDEVRVYNRPLSQVEIQSDMGTAMSGAAAAAPAFVLAAPPSMNQDALATGQATSLLTSA